MTERPKLLRLKKRIIVLYYNLKLTVKRQKFHLENTGGLDPSSFKKSQQTITISCVALLLIKRKHYTGLD